MLFLINWVPCLLGSNGCGGTVRSFRGLVPPGKFAHVIVSYLVCRSRVYTVGSDFAVVSVFFPLV